MCGANPSSCTMPPAATCSLCATSYCPTHQAVTPNGNAMLVCTTCQRTYSTSASGEVPQSLMAAHARWAETRRPPQQAFDYYPNRWVESLPEHADFIKGLPPSLSRTFISGLGAGAHEHETTAVHTFIASQIWGWGIRVGYGPFRTNVALSTAQSPSLPLTPPQKLQEVARLIREDGILAGFRALGTTCKLDRIGPSFGTKYLFFVSAIPSRHPALVLDSRVAVWFNTNTSLRLDANLWSSHQYGQYLYAMYSWAADLGEPPDAVEFIVFQAPKSGPPTGRRQVIVSDPGTCPKCHLRLPASGKCDNCDG